MKVFALFVALTLTACAVHHVTPYVPDASLAPETADATLASASCAEASTGTERAICASPALVAANQEMLQALHANLRAAPFFGRDALLASQRAWALKLPSQCAEAPACLQSALASRIAALRAWPAPLPPSGAIAQYVNLRASAGAAPQPDPAFCTEFATRANAALARSGGLDPAAMSYGEIAGTHGPAAAAGFAVDLYDANAFALFERRARGAGFAGAPPMLTAASLTGLVEAQNPANQGGRFSAYASQTGDYGSLDVFRATGRVLAMAADPWGSTTPAAPGEAAHAGIWALGGANPSPVCLFDTYTRPAEPGPFETLPDFTPWRATLAQIRATAALPLGNTFLRDQGQVAADTNFLLLHMPLLAVAQASRADATLWLRLRHDAVLDALFTWSATSPTNKALFTQAFAQLRPAATDLVRAYQTTQGLSAKEATQAAGLAMMELLYQATNTIAPGIGAEPYPLKGARPRYPILAAPQ